MLRSLLSLTKCSPTRNWAFSSAASTAPAALPIIEAGKRNIKQSPLKIKFLVSLIRKAWVPDALAQLKFSPKHRAVDIAKIVSRAAALAKIYHNYIPEELLVKEVVVTKGLQMKRMRIMGRGRTGYGYKRQSHVLVKLEPADFTSLISSCNDPHQRATWRKRQAIALKKKEEGSISVSSEPAK